jgi:glycosyltransferase involved in cell wall biosynthesis
MRVGGGTRLKIYESMAARVPVVSTTVGAEGLAVEDGQTIFLADDPASFADRCLALMEDQDLAARLACAGEALATRFSWDHSARQFESILESA